MNEPLISVILPVYNVERYVAAAIQSVLNQTYRNFELIILNDASTDGSKEIIFSFTDSRIRYVENERNLMLIKTLNKGVGLAKGKYIARMDADDICVPSRFERQICFLERDQTYIMCGSWAKIIDSDGNKTGRIKRIDSDGLLKVNMLFTTPFVHPTVMIRTDALKKNLYSEEALHCEDMELWSRLAMNESFRFANIPEYLLNYRWHDRNISVEHSVHQSNFRSKVLGPYVERLSGTLTEDDSRTHFSLFESNVDFKNSCIREKTRKWIRFLLEQNATKKIYDESDLKALLLSRWFLLNVRSRRFYMFSSGISLFSRSVFIKAFRLLYYK